MQLERPETTGFRYDSPTIIHAHIQDTGMVNNHIVYCFHYRDIRDIAGDV